MSIAMTITVFAAANLLLAAFLNYLTWRLSPDPKIGWVVAAGVLIACLSLGRSGLALYSDTGESPHSDWPLHIIAITGLIALGLALLSLRRVVQPSGDPLAVGLVLGTIAVGCLVLPVTASTPIPAWVLLTVIASSHLTLAIAVVCNTALPRSAAALLVVSTAIIAIGFLIAPVGLSGTLWEVVASLALAVTAGAWTLASFANLRSDMSRAQLHSEDLQDMLMATVSTDRDHHERWHELRSTVAGLVNAFGLLQRHEVDPEVRLRLESTMQSELARMQRLLSDEKDLPTIIDLDEALDAILGLHRLKGRQIDFTPSGDLVRGRYDALAEIVGILVDNASTHGGSDESVVAVTGGDDMVEITVTDSGIGIPTDERERIFGWGARGTDSPGQGIGLHLAQRLVHEGGGTLTCAEPVGGGSSFIISLPAARRSLEDDHVNTAL